MSDDRSASQVEADELSEALAVVGRYLDSASVRALEPEQAAGLFEMGARLVDVGMMQTGNLAARLGSVAVSAVLRDMAKVYESQVER